MNILRVLLGNIAAIWLADYFVNGFSYNGEYVSLIIVGVILGLLMLFVKPILKFISAPIIWITAGLFILVINGFILWGIDTFTVYITIIGFWPLLYGTLIVTLMNLIVKGFKL